MPAAIERGTVAEKSWFLACIIGVLAYAVLRWFTVGLVTRLLSAKPNQEASCPR